MAHIIGTGRYARETYPEPGRGGGSAPSAITEPVDTIARASASRLVDLAAGTLPDGALVFARSVRDFFVLHKASALAADNITIANAVGGGQWLRKFTPSVRWLTRAEWYIDPAAADDEGTGAVGDPLQSHAELGRRALNQGRTLNQDVLVNIVADLPETDPIELDFAQPVGSELAPNNVRYLGAPATIRAGTLSAVTPLNVGVALTTVTDAVGGSFAAEIDQRIRMTGGANAGARAWLIRDDGGDTATTSAFFSTPVPEGLLAPTLTNPTADDYVVETLPLVRLGRVKMTQGPVNGSIYQLIFEDLSVGTANNNPPRCNSMDSALFRGCDLLNQVWFKADLVAQGCAIKGSSFFNSTVSALACAIIDSSYSASESNLTIGYETVAMGVSLIPSTVTGCIAQLLSQSSFDAATSGVVLMPGVTARADDLLWGSGNTDYGINARGGCLYYDAAAKPTITGAVADTRVGGIDKSYADIPFFNAANGGCVVDTPT